MELLVAWLSGRERVKLSPGGAFIHVRRGRYLASLRAPTNDTIPRGRARMTELAHVRVERDDELAIVTVDRQEKLNALNADVISEIGEAFETLRDDEKV